MKIIQKNWYLFMVLSLCFSQEVLPLTQRYFHTEDMGYDYSRGTYLIVLADASLESILREEDTGDFIHFKKTQGYDVAVITFEGIGGTADNLHNYLKYYINNSITVPPKHPCVNIFPTNERIGLRFSKLFSDPKNI